MPEPVSIATLYGFAATVWGYVKWPFKQARLALRLNTRVDELEQQLKILRDKSEPPSPYRKCPKCGEKDLRLIDRYRHRGDDVFSRRRYFHEKWRCYSCDFVDQINLEEPGG
jgi:hypothetical protein